MAALKLILILICGVQMGTCINWKITMFIGNGQYAESSGSFYLDVFGTENNRNGIELGNSFEKNEEKEIYVDANFGKINSVRIYTYMNDGILLLLLILSDGTRSYNFPCDCWIDGPVFGSYWSKSMTATDCNWNVLSPNCAEMGNSCQIGECKTCISGYHLNGTSCIQSDPCSLSTHIPHIEMYRPTNTHAISASAYLTEGWYSGGQYLLLTWSPELDLPRCGAESQIWMNGTLPVADGIQHVRELCVTNRTTGNTCTDYKMSTYVKNCTTHIMYYLTTPTVNSAYCFDIPSGSSDPPPSYLPARAKIKYELHWISALNYNGASRPSLNYNGAARPSLRFICDFNRDVTNVFYYAIYFYVNNRYVNFGSDLVVYNTTEAYVTEESLVSLFGFTAGITISCSVGVRSSRNGRTGSLVISEGFYAGIRMLDQSVSVERGTNSSVYFEQTIPFGCMHDPSLVQSSCTLTLHITRTSTENTCSSNTVHHRGQCVLELPGVTKTASIGSDTWTPQIYNFEIVSIESERGSYRLSKYQFLFKLETSSSHHHFWRNSQSDEVVVGVSEGERTGNWQGRKCQVYCDPHMLSFDGMNYELQYAGTFMLFKSENPPMQVQVKITSCYRTGRGPYCACGLVAVAGRDVFQFYTCDGHRISKYKSCLDGVLKVVKVSTKNYKIYLPTGAVVSIRHRGNGLLDIDITPTIHEYRGKISGLCGDFDGNVYNDCVSKGGSMPCQKPFRGQRGYNYHPNSFTQSYELSDEENLFNGKLLDIESLDPYPRSYNTCACSQSKNEVSSDIETAICSPIQYGRCINPRKEVRCTASKRRLTRRKRQVDSTDNNQHHSITKRSTIISETEAIQLCIEALSTVTNEACSDIGVNSTGIEINNCAADLMLTGDGNWTKFAIDRSEAICLETLEKNTTLQEDYPDISNVIRNNTCPNSCSERGSCTNGKCVCEEGFAAEDCSFDLNTPLQIYGLDNDGLCDIDDGCSFVVVEGFEFPSDRNYTCQFSGRATMMGDIYQTLEMFNVSADHQSLFEIICDLPDREVPVNSLGIEYNVSVAMDGFEFGDAINFVVINTICQNYNNISGNIYFYIQDGFCFINGTCYPEGAYKENVLCLECKPDENMYMWSNSSSEDCVVSDKDTQDSTTNFLIVVVSAVVGFLFVCLLIFVMWCIYKKKNKSRQEIRDITSSDSFQGKEGTPSLAWLNEDMLISNIKTEETTSKVSRPKKKKRTKNPNIRNPKHDSHDTEVHSTFYIANESMKSVQDCNKERKKEMSLQVKQVNSITVFSEGVPSVADPNEEEAQNRIESRAEKEADGTYSNQSTHITTDVGSNDLPSKENPRERDPAMLESESMLQSSSSKDMGKRKKKKRKRERRKVEPESPIGELAIVTEDGNDERAKKKSKKRKKERRKEVSQPMTYANPLSDFLGEVEGFPSVDVPNESMLQSNTSKDTEKRKKKKRRERKKDAEPPIEESDFVPGEHNDRRSQKNSKKRNKERRKELSHQLKHADSVGFCSNEDKGVLSVDAPDEEFFRKKVAMETEDEEVRTTSSHHYASVFSDFCRDDEGVPCVPASYEEMSRSRIEMKTEDKEDRTTSNQSTQIIDSQLTDSDSNDELYTAYLTITDVADNNSLSGEDTR